MLKVPGRTYPLSLSFRFGEEIAEAANRVISSKSNRSEVLLRGLPGKGSTIGPIQRGEAQTRIFRTNTSVLKEALNLSDLGVTTQIVGDMSEMRHKIEGAYSLLKGATHEVKHPAFHQFKNWDELEGWMYRNQDTEITQIANLVKAYVRRIDALLKICSKQASSGEVRLITAHRAKGCEWDNVVIGQDFDERLDGLLLNGRSRSPQADEELNLLYVALTRTRKRLESKSEALKAILK
ncbi:putative DNA helicase (plasmid) [Pseudomonas aeruginosa]|nr:putative DNA helicase [Pseudomonas aeruginosa]